VTSTEGHLINNYWNTKTGKVIARGAMKTTIENLLDDLKQQGLQGRVVPARHVQDLRLNIEGQYTEGQLAEEFYRERLQFYRFDVTADFPAAQSIIVLAMPRPQTPVNFVYHQKPITLTLPPTYAGYAAISHQVGEMLATVLTPQGYHLTPAILPLKLLAACSGLVEYGRNNVTYIPGMGSFFQLVAYYSDLACPESTWQDSWNSPHLMKRCDTCQACIKKCPTGAITLDRFLLHADRCLVFHNERPATHAFPDWIDPGMHQCLMGCMVCQQYCPEDKPFLGWFEASVDFTEQETELLLKGVHKDQLPDVTVKKLAYLELIDDLDKFPRNLGAIVNRSG
jgi:epoxyqueuosine reductase